MFFLSRVLWLKVTGFTIVGSIMLQVWCIYFFLSWGNFVLNVLPLHLFRKDVRSLHVHLENKLILPMG